MRPTYEAPRETQLDTGAKTGAKLYWGGAKLRMCELRAAGGT